MKKLIELVQRSKIQLQWKLQGGFLITNLLLIATLGLALFTLFGTTEGLKALKTSSARSQAVSEIEALENSLVATGMDYIWSGNLARLVKFETVRADLKEAISGFRPNSLQKENFEEAKVEIDGLIGIMDQITQLDGSSQLKQAADLWRSKGSAQAARAFREIQEIGPQEEHVASLEFDQTVGQAFSNSIIIGGLAILALILAVFVSWVLTVSLTRPVKNLQQNLVNLAKGDLTQQVKMVNQDEIGDLGQTYNKTVSSLQELVKKLYTQSSSVSTATAELMAQASSQVSGSSQQARAITEATQSLKQLNQTAEAIGQRTASTAEAAKHSLEQAQAVSQLADEMNAAQERGRGTVARTIKGLATVKDQVAAIEQQLEGLVNQSSVIYKVINLIDNISRETHLLALNAAIEAAGAGVFGERFGIVAGEVKSLASRSVVATTEIRSALTSIVNSLQEASTRTKQGLIEAQQGVEDARHSDTSLVELASLSDQVQSAARAIVEEVGRTAAMAGEIGVATLQQQTSSKEMLEKMFEIEAVTSQNLSGIRQGENAIQQINLSARELEQSADNFRLVA